MKMTKIKRTLKSWLKTGSKILGAYETLQLKPFLLFYREAFYRKIISEPSYERKETNDVNIFIIFRNGDRKIMEPIRKTIDDHLPYNTYKKAMSWRQGKDSEEQQV